MPLLETRDLTRRFPGVLALDRVNFSAEAGEVHAIVGANGAGKSTLMNIFAGALLPSSGELRLAGERVELESPAIAREKGVSIVYQEFISIGEISVADNIFLGREFTGRGGLIDRKRAVIEARALLERLGINLPPEALVSSLSVADRQLVELARALATTARVLILDEPTAVLSLAEQGKLFKVIASLRSSGLLILYISHRLEEVFAIADRVSVMRDGNLVATRDRATLSHSELVRLMTGRQLQQNVAPAALPTDAKPILTVSGDGAPDEGLTIATGEILGFVGLVGAGRTWLARRIAGLSPRAGLRVSLNGASLPGEAHAALARGVVYLTEDRKVSGIFAPLAITANATAASLRRFTRAGILARRREKREAGQLLKDLQLVAASLDAAIGGLSGGNQQKVLIARALLAEPKVLICDEPTRGVDVGAKEEIYKILRTLASRGVAVIVISSEFSELLALCHRLAVVKSGRIIATLNNENLDEHRLLEIATGASASV